VSGNGSPAAGARPPAKIDRTIAAIVASAARPRTDTFMQGIYFDLKEVPLQ
jgi:hypothetical protein